MPTIKQYSFAGGEVSSQLQARSDLARRRTGCKRLQNFLLKPSGAVFNRAGFRFVRAVRDSTKGVRLVPFVAASDQSYVLEFGEYYMRVHTSGATVLYEQGTHDTFDDSDDLIDTTANWYPESLGGVTLHNHTKDITGSVPTSGGFINTEIYCASDLVPLWDIGDKYELEDAPYELVTPYSEADLEDLRWAQNNDVLILVHPSYPPMELRRFGDARWTLLPFTTDKQIQPPTAVSSTGWPTTGINEQWQYVVVSVDENENASVGSGVHTPSSSNMNFSSQYPTISFTAPAAGLTPVRYDVYRGRYGHFGYIGSTDNTSTPGYVDDGRPPDYSDPPPSAFDPFIVENDQPTEGKRCTFPSPTSDTAATKLQAPEAADDTYVYDYSVLFANLLPGTNTKSISLEFWARPSGGGAWTSLGTQTLTETVGSFDATGRGYKYSSSMDGLAANSEFRIEVTSADSNVTLQRSGVSWYAEIASDDIVTYPKTVCWYEQRLVFGGFTHNAQLLRASQTGDFRNFDRASPTRDDDGIDLTLAANTLDEIRWMISMGRLLIGTASGEWIVGGVEGAPLTPSSFDAKSPFKTPASKIPPAVIGTSVLMLSDRGRSLHEIKFNPLLGGVDPREPRDLSVLASHLTEDYDIIDMGYAHIPDRTLWCVRSDGVLLALTYVPEHEVWGWHRHVTDGEVESICVVPEGRADRVYIVVKRTINGSTKRYIEELDARNHTSLADAVFLDSSLTYDGRNTGSTTITPTGGSTWLANESITLVASASTFTSSDVGQRIELTGSDSKTCRWHITAYTSGTQVTAYALTDVPASLQSTATSTWARAVNTFSGLSHLEAETITLWLDGATKTTATVSSGAVTTSGTWSIRAVAGLPYTSELWTLPIELDGRARAAPKTAPMIGIEAGDYANLQCGVDPNNLATVNHWRSEPGESTADGTMLLTSVPRSSYRSLSFFFKHTAPSPVSIHAVLPEVSVGN